MARKMNAILGWGIMGAMLSSAQGAGSTIDPIMPGEPRWGKSRSGRMKRRVLNPEGFRGKPTKRRLKVKLARKAKLKNQKR